MEYEEGRIITEEERDGKLTEWLNKNQYYLEDVSAGKYRIKKAEEPSREIIIDELRYRRERECFTVVNRGQLWYDRLSDERRAELNVWYSAWLDVTETLAVPDRPEWTEEV